MGKIAAIAKNALTETVRQPVFVVILGIGAFMIALSPSFSMFTLMNDVKLLKDMGLATILLTGLLQAAFSAGNVISNEVENKTILTVLTKPVSKTQFILGKFTGIALALIASAYLLTLILHYSCGSCQLFSRPPVLQFLFWILHSKFQFYVHTARFH
jgi:ABC-type transport system involved in multi-copper enzyme maturation permease subunit